MDVIEMVYWTTKFREAALEMISSAHGDGLATKLYTDMSSAWYASWELRFKIQAGVL